MNQRSQELSEKLIKYNKELHNLIDHTETPDVMLKGLSDLTDLAVECGQLDDSSQDTFSEVKRVCLVRVRLTRDEIEKLFDTKTASIYGMGLFIPLEGILLSYDMRKKLEYDRSLAHIRVMLNLNDIPEDVLEIYNFGLAIPAGGGLFVPKKTRLMEWISSTRCLRYLDLEEEFL